MPPLALPRPAVVTLTVGAIVLGVTVALAPVVAAAPGVWVHVDAAWAVDGQPVWDVPGLGVTRYADGFHYNDVGAADGARIVSLA